MAVITFVFFSPIELFSSFQASPLPPKIELRLDHSIILPSGATEKIDLDVDIKSGDIYILDRDDGKVWIYGESGEPIRSLRARNDDTIPHRSYYGIEVTNQGETVLSNFYLRRFEYYSKDGAFLRSAPLGHFYMTRFHFLDENRKLATILPIGSGEYRESLAILDAQNQVVDVLRSIPIYGPTGSVDPFGPKFNWDIDGKGLIFLSFSVEYRISVFEASGAKLREIEKDYRRLEITNAEKEKSKAEIPPNEKIEFSQFHTSFQDFVVDEKGIIFIRTWEKETDTGGWKIHVLDAEGHDTGSFVVSGQIKIVRRGKVYVLSTDSQGRVCLNRYSILST